MRYLILTFILLTACAADSAPPGDLCGRGECPEQPATASAEEADIKEGGVPDANKDGVQFLELAWSSFVVHTHIDADSDWCAGAFGSGAPCLKSRRTRVARFRDYNNSGQWRTIAGVYVSFGWYNLSWNTQLPTYTFDLCLANTGQCVDAANRRSSVIHDFDGISYGQGYIEFDVYLNPPAGTTSSAPKFYPNATINGLYVY